MPSPSLKLLNFNQDNPSKNAIEIPLREIWSKHSYQNIVTKLWSHCYIYTIRFEPGGKIFLVTTQTETTTLHLFYENSFILRRPTAANFADILKIAI